MWAVCLLVRYSGAKQNSPKCLVLLCCLPIAWHLLTHFCYMGKRIEKVSQVRDRKGSEYVHGIEFVPNLSLAPALAAVSPGVSSSGGHRHARILPEGSCVITCPTSPRLGLLALLVLTPRGYPSFSVTQVSVVSLTVLHSWALKCLRGRHRSAVPPSAPYLHPRHWSGGSPLFRLPPLLPRWLPLGWDRWYLSLLCRVTQLPAFRALSTLRHKTLLFVPQAWPVQWAHTESGTRLVAAGRTGSRSDACSSLVRPTVSLGPSVLMEWIK